jgi:hypothetical protein
MPCSGPTDPATHSPTSAPKRQPCTLEMIELPSTTENLRSSIATTNNILLQRYVSYIATATVDLELRVNY